MHFVFESSRIIIALSLLSLSLELQEPEESQDDQVTEGVQVDEDAGPFEGLEYRSIGPSSGGRVSRVAGIPDDPLTYYAATAAGGVWKTIQGGLEWFPIFDDQDISSIGSIAVSPSDPNVVWVGSGEANIRGNVAEGNGIYRSTDAGKTWIHVWEAEGQIGTLIVHPESPDIAFAAALGSPFGPTAERGIYRTLDGGETWELVLFVNEDTGASDVCFAPDNPRILFAGTWQARRTPWDLTSGGKGSGLWMSKDTGDTWTQLKENGLPEGLWGRVGVIASSSERIFALIEAHEGGLFRTDDGGDTWTLVNDSNGLTQRAWYYSTLTIDPLDDDVVWFPQVNMLKTEDGGKTIRSVKGGGWDYHDIWIAPENSLRMIVASDAGISLSRDGGETWVRPPLPLAQFYHVSIDSRSPYRVLGSLQDFGTASGPSRTLHGDGILLSDWHGVGGGEAGFVVADPSDPDIVYAGEYLGIITRWNDRLKKATNASVYPFDGSGHAGKNLKYRFQWTAPISISPHDPKTVYHAANVLFRTRDEGQSWEAISPDLTRNDPTKQEWSGGPITGDNTGVEFYGTIFALAESPIQKNVIWVGTDDGLIHFTENGGADWTNVTPKDAPEWGTVSCIELSTVDPSTAYAIYDAHRLDDETPYLWKTEDSGKTWVSLSGDLDSEVYLHVIRQDRLVPDLLYLGTERGMMVSKYGGKQWQSLALNMPPVAIVDLALSENDLIVATLGRSAWILDDLTPVRTWSDEIEGASAHFFAPLKTIAWQMGEAQDGSRDGAGENPPSGVRLTYSLKEEIKEDITLRVTDGDGRLVRELSSVAKALYVSVDHPDSAPDSKSEPEMTKTKGINRVSWDLHYDGPTWVQGALLDWGSPGPGPMALPGTYSLELIVGKESYKQVVEVVEDPRITQPIKVRRQQLEFALAASDLFSRISKTIEKIRSIESQIKSRSALLESIDEDEDSEWKPIVELGRIILERLESIESELHNPRATVGYDILAGRHGGAMLHSQVEWLFMIARNHLGPPTQGMRESFEVYTNQFSESLKALATLEAERLAELETLAKDKNVPFVFTRR